MLGQVTGNTDTQDSPRPGVGEATTFPLIVYSAALHGGYIQMAIFPRTPKWESRNCPEIVPVGVPELWELISPDCRVRSQRGLKQSCNPRRDLSNAVLHSQIGCRKEVDSRLLVVRSQTASLTPDPSFSHNLCLRRPNEQCEPILTSTFQELFNGLKSATIH